RRSDAGGGGWVVKRTPPPPSAAACNPAGGAAWGGGAATGGGGRDGDPDDGVEIVDGTAWQWGVSAGVRGSGHTQSCGWGGGDAGDGAGGGARLVGGTTPGWRESGRDMVVAPAGGVGEGRDGVGGGPAMRRRGLAVMRPAAGLWARLGGSAVYDVAGGGCAM